jgi:hypothetical protein
MVPPFAHAELFASAMAAFFIEIVAIELSAE